MTGGLQQAARVRRSLEQDYVSDLEAFNRATHPDALRELQLVPAEEWQADANDQADDDAPDAHPTLPARFGFLLFLFVAAVIAHHAPWSAAL